MSVKKTVGMLDNISEIEFDDSYENSKNEDDVLETVAAQYK